MVAERQKAVNVVNNGLKTLPMDKVFAIRDFVITMTDIKKTGGPCPVICHIILEIEGILKKQ